MLENKNSKHLPKLQNITIENFSLYPSNLKLSYDFIEGVNLIIGGNGVGKTTFLNILKYALIGLYKKEIDVKRREYSGTEYRYDKRVNLPYNYFSNRMNPLAEYNTEARVRLTFNLNEEEFEVTRNLFQPKVEKVFHTVNNIRKEILGEVVSQFEFDNLFSDKKKNIEKLHNTLQWKYEELIGKSSNHEIFDNLIFIINDVLFFNESRKTIMWDSLIQNKLMSKFFIDPKLDEKKEEYEREAKYQNSLSRHKSEDIRAIKKIFDNLSKNEDITEYNELVLSIEEEKKIIDKLFLDLEQNQKDREKKETDINKLYSERNGLSKKIEDLEDLKKNEEKKIFSSFFKKTTPKYNDFFKSLKISGDCPLCNNELEHKLYEEIVSHESDCMLCGSSINNSEITSDKLKSIKSEISDNFKLLRIVEKKIIDEEEMLKKFDFSFREISLKLNKHQSKLRQLEFAIQKHQKENSDNSDSEFKAMKARIDELEKEKDLALNKSKIANQKAQEILKKIDEQRLDSREFLSNIFNSYGSKFLGVKCELVYEDPKDNEGKRYLPRINGIERMDEEELSESQRFFIDQSFRLSLLNYFNSSSSFFMCETPDSSLDISYERNAAKIYLEYVKDPNQLILTSNLNNSEFLEYLIEKSNKINYINLLKFGKKSDIQANSDQLIQASNKIENMINGKR